MAANNFAAALAAALVHEGGWADHPKDPGGATMKGVTLGTYRQYHPGATKEQLRNISDADLQRIYRDGYWNKIRGDDLPKGLDYAVFDFAVNSGPGRAAKYLQAILGVTQDGEIGPVTIAAAKEANVRDVIEELCSRRMGFLRGLPTFGTFGKGWTRRVDSVRKDALLMAVAPIDAPILQPAPEQPPVRIPDPPAGKSAIPGIIAAVIILAILAVAFFIFGA